jgi:hypothetical protein
MHVAPDLGSCTRNSCGCGPGPDFFIFRYTGRNWQHAATERRSLTKELATGVIAWNVPAAGIANVIPDGRSRGWIPVCVISTARMPILLFAYHSLNGRPGRRAHR